MSIERVSSYESGVFWRVRSKSGKVLGTHKRRKDAVRQLGAIEAAKADRKKRQPKGEKR